MGMQFLDREAGHWRLQDGALAARGKAMNGSGMLATDYVASAPVDLSSDVPRDEAKMSFRSYRASVWSGKRLDT